MKIAFQHRSLSYLLCLSLIFIGCASTFTPGPVLVSSGIRFQLLYPEAKTVAIAGNFNNWDPTTHILDKDSAASWFIILPLSKGRYQYLFVIDQKTWVPDPGAEMLIDDGFGQKNSLLIVQ